MNDEMYVIIYIKYNQIYIIIVEYSSTIYIWYWQQVVKCFTNSIIHFESKIFLLKKSRYTTQKNPFTSLKGK